MKDTDIPTEIVHGGAGVLPQAGAVNVPIYLTSTFRQPSFEDPGNYGYSRGKKPTREAVELLIAKLEGGTYGFGFASGMAATQAALSLLKSGDKVLVSSNVYGGTYGLLAEILSSYGISFSLEDMTDLSVLEEKITDDVRAIFVETPSNPSLTVTDLKKVAEISERHRLLSIVDNTFMSPYLQRPLDFGIDIVVESATKYLSGHSDIIAGVLAVKDEKIASRIHMAQGLIGGILQPFDAFLLARGIRTLAVRQDRAVQNAEKIADFLQRQPFITAIHYPGLKSDPGYEIQRRQARNGGAMISFELAESIDIPVFLESLRLITFGASLGGVESLIGHPATTSHRGIPKTVRERTGISDRLIRLSAGIEYSDDIINDLKQAFEKADSVN